MSTFFQAFIMAFREGLEAFLIVSILLSYLRRSRQEKYISSLWGGLIAAIIGSFLLGAGLFALRSFLGGTSTTAKVWESGASFVAVLLITSFIIWMMRHSKFLKQEVEQQAALKLSSTGIFLLTFFMVIREGAEIAIFAFAGQYSVLPVTLGILLSIVVVTLIYYSIVNVSLGTIFRVTLFYLILQAGFLLGYSLHEGLSALREGGVLAADHWAYLKAFDLSGTIFDHKEGALGIAFYVAFGWYSKPEIVQFLLQYGYSLGLLVVWYFIDQQDRASLPKK